ncbi:MAG: substrate-binding domain-containing protein [Williamsia sp.]|nr:substrate-binding domain-containing protein [Williamsia sp.]
MKKRFHKPFRPEALFVILICVGLLFSCSETEPEKKYKIGFSQCTGADIWRKAMLESMQQELSFHPGTELVYRDARDNSDLQVRQIQELLDENIDILIVSPNEAQPLTPIIEYSFNKGIPVVFIDRKTASSLYTSFVGADNFEIGKMAGDYIANLIKDSCNVVEIIGLPGSTPAIERERGFAEGIKSKPHIKIKAQIYGNWLKQHAVEELTKIKDQLRPNDLVFAHNDRMALGAYEVYNKLGMAKQARFIGVDGSFGPGGGIQFVSDSILFATMLYPTGGQEAIQTAFKILSREPFNKENRLQTLVIDRSNVRLMKLQTDKITSQQKDIEKQQTILAEQKRLYNDQRLLLYIVIGALLLVVVLGSIAVYAFRNNERKNKTLALQNQEILKQKNQLIEMTAAAKEATDAKFNFFTKISHEFKTPLTLILGPLEEALTSPKLHFTVKNNLHLVQKNVMRLLRLINQLMDFRKIEHGKIKLRASENDLVHFVSEIAEAFNEIAGKKHISFNVNSKYREIKAWFDTNMLDKVIFNLLSNAFKFTNEHGSIYINIDKSADEVWATIEVEDSGVGMSPDAVEHAFDLFYQGHETTFKGSGLGLNLSKELIDIHKGMITLKSEKWKGTTFKIFLRLGNLHIGKDEMAENTASPSTSYADLKIYSTDIELPSPEKALSEETTPKEHSILLVEDNADLRKFVKSRLSNLFEILEADKGTTGLNLAFETVPDLIICDIVLPSPHGLEITEKLKTDVRTSHIPIILLTAKGDIEQQIEGMKLMADAFIVKPFNLQYLEETVKSLLRNRSLLREHYTSELPSETKAFSAKKIDRKFINEFTALVENNISNENFSVEDICREIGIPRVQLYRKLKALLGYNVNDYILNVRLQKAKYLLLNDSCTISEIAFKVGFSSQAYFSTVFKAKCAVTPTEFKEKAKNRNGVK